MRSLLLHVCRMLTKSHTKISYEDDPTTHVPYGYRIYIFVNMSKGKEKGRLVLDLYCVHARDALWHHR